MRRRAVLACAGLAVALAAAASADVSPSPRPARRAARPKPRPSASPAPSPSPSARTYTEDDLKKASGRVESAVAGVEQPQTGGDEGNGTKVGATSSGGEQAWRGRGSEARDAVAAADAKASAIQARIDALRLDSGATNVMDPNREQNRQAAIASAMAELEKAKADADAARQALAALEEEARRAGVPPGWVR